MSAWVKWAFFAGRVFKIIHINLSKKHYSELSGFSKSLFCNYAMSWMTNRSKRNFEMNNRYPFRRCEKIYVGILNLIVENILIEGGPGAEPPENFTVLGYIFLWILFRKCIFSSEISVKITYRMQNFRLRRGSAWVKWAKPILLKPCSAWVKCARDLSAPWL